MTTLTADAAWVGSVGQWVHTPTENVGMTRGFEPLHETLALARRPMRVLAPVIEITTLTMLYPWEHLALGRAVALQLVYNDDAGHIPQALEQLAKELLGGLLVPPALHQDVEDVVVLIHRSSQVMTPAVNGQKHLIDPPVPAVQLGEVGDTVDRRIEQRGDQRDLAGPEARPADAIPHLSGH